MKQILLILSLLALVTACQDKTTYKVIGKTTDLADGTKVYLCEDLFRKIVADSTTIKDNQFVFEGKLDKPIMRNLKIEGLGLKQEEIAEGLDIDDFAGVPTLLIVEPNKTVELTVYDNDKGYFRTIGSPLTRKHATFWGNMGTMGAPDSECILDMMKENKDNAIGMFYFSNIIEFISPNSKKLKEMYPLFSDKKGENKKLDEVLTYIENLDNHAAIGTKYIDIKGKTLEGKEIALSDYVGKKDFVLLHFWSWTSGGTYDTPYLLDAYNKYKDKNFEIVEVSLDLNSKSWEEHISENNIKWPLMSDKKSIFHFIKTYALFDKPYTILIDKEGTIIDRNIPNTELDAKLSKLLK